MMKLYRDASCHKTKTMNCKRDKPEIFDSNRAIVIDNKKKKESTNIEMAESNPRTQGKVWDMYQTINVGSLISIKFSLILTGSAGSWYWLNHGVSLRLGGT